MKTQEPLEGRRRNCAICGKEIFCGGDWAYRRGYDGTKMIYLCSWKHLNEYDRRKEDEKQRNKEKRAGKRFAIQGNSSGAEQRKRRRAKSEAGNGGDV